MDSAPALAPGVPADYYHRISNIEDHHWWSLGMRALSATLLGEHLTRPGSRLLDAGCGAGGFLRWAIDRGSFSHAAGVDIASSALDLAQRRVPEAEFRAAALHELPFENGSFDLVFCNDVLQHVPESELTESISELRRVTAPAGVILVRTNGSQEHRQQRDDWRAFDRSSLVELFERGGLTCLRVTYANMLGSMIAAAMGHTPHAPTTSADGVPAAAGRLRTAVGGRALALEARFLAHPGRSLPFGHTLFAVGDPA
jgi:SAM-dependent methyltransferase